MKTKLTKKEVQSIVALLDDSYEDVAAFLHYSTPYELLIAVILSAQCTDTRVNKITAALFADANTPQQILALGTEGLTRYIKSAGLYRSKSKNIIAATEMLLERFDGKVPNNMEDLLTLPGVGRKTANVVLSHAFGQDAIAVDTHVFRVSNRLGLVCEKDPVATEFALMKVLDKNMWSKMHYKIILHGRKICTARSPKCDACMLNTYCLYWQKQQKSRG
ncbi:MAG: endonuclease III [Eubacteriaceae bacterium]|nr:endonuclease III [Eubacteriaceae bacterium]